MNVNIREESYVVRSWCYTMGGQYNNRKFDSLEKAKEFYKNNKWPDYVSAIIVKITE